MLKVVFYTDAAGDWRWRIVTENGDTIADSSEGYRNLKDARDEFDRIQSETIKVEGV